MPYVLVRESFINSYCCVEGLPLNEGKILGNGTFCHHLHKKVMVGFCDTREAHPASLDRKRRHLQSLQFLLPKHRAFMLLFKTVFGETIYKCK